VNPAVINTPKAVKIPICSLDRQSAGLNLVVHQHHARLRRTTDPDLMTPAPPPCAPSSRRHQVTPMVLLTLPGRSTTVVQRRRDRSGLGGPALGSGLSFFFKNFNYFIKLMVTGYFGILIAGC
jgi:hypothetical protein